MKTVIYLLLTFFLLISCDHNINNQSIIDLVGTWKLKSVTFEGDLILSPPSIVTIDFSEDTTMNNLNFSGKSTCNFYGGEVISLTKESISFSSMYTTEISCTDILNTFEENYYMWLNSSEHYTINNNTLVLSFDNNSTMEFEKE